MKSLTGSKLCRITIQATFPPSKKGKEEEKRKRNVGENRQPLWCLQAALPKKKKKEKKKKRGKLGGNELYYKF
jgi:hypothetical protein